MSWNIKTPGDYINGPLTVAGSATITGDLTVDTSTLKVVSSTDRVGIGTASPGKRCEINQSANAITTIGSGEILRLIGDDGNTNSRITEVGFGSGPTGATFAPVIVGAVNTSISGYGTKDFYVATRTGIADVAPLERLRVTAAGDVSVSTGNVVMSNGKGIDFSATAGTGTSEILNDYEEGTWTPTVVAETGTIGATVVNSANYTKVGRLVSVTFDITITSAGTGTAGLKVSLPFSPSVAGNTCGVLREYQVTGNMGQVYKYDATNALCNLYNNSTLIVANYRIMASYTYFV
jgi:hypothetical protein